MGLLDYLKAFFRTGGPPPAPRRLDGRSKILLAASLKMLTEEEPGWIGLTIGYGDVVPRHGFGLRRHVARLHREAGIEIKVVSTDNPPTGAGEDGVPRRLGEPAFQRSNSTIRTHARRTMCRSAADVL
jgi:hypothetical protein